MGGSIHIHGTTSSIIDTVFVCRASGATPAKWLFDSTERLVEIVSNDLAQLSAAGRRATHGDTRCIVFGHLTRIAVWQLRLDWDRSVSTAEKLNIFRVTMTGYGDPDELARLAAISEPLEDPPLFAPITTRSDEGAYDAVSF